MTSAKDPRRKPLRPSIKDVACAAGVSISTVSRALRGYTDVNPDTRSRVERVALELGYTPDASGQNLKSGRSNAVTVLVSGNHGPALLDYFYAEVLGGVEACLEAHDLSLMLVRAVTPKAQRRVLQGGVSDGVIALGCDLPLDFLQQLRRRDTPLVLADATSWASDVPSVTAANEMGGYTATRHLLEQGRTRVAFIAETADDPNFKLRQKGYERALLEADLPVETDLVQTGSLGIEGGYLATQKLLSAGRPNAIFAANDTAAFGALRVLDEYNLRAPSDVAVIGFDDVELSKYTAPPLTTMHIPRQRMGFEAASRLLQLLGNGAPDSLELPVPLVIRQST